MHRGHRVGFGTPPDREDPERTLSVRPTPSDALVLFGVTGDLAYKTFPALYAMVKTGALTVPIVGVASTKLSLEQLRRRATESIKHSGVTIDRKVLKRLLSLLRYVAGDYTDAQTFVALKAAMGDARRPAY